MEDTDRISGYVGVETKTGRSRAGPNCSVALFGGFSSSVSFSFWSSPAQAPLFRVFIKIRAPYEAWKRTGW